MVFFIAILDSTIPYRLTEIVPFLGVSASVVAFTVFLIYTFSKYQKLDFTVLLVTNSYIIMTLLFTIIKDTSNVVSCLYWMWRPLIYSAFMLVLIREDESVLNAFLYAVRDSVLIFFVVSVAMAIIYKNKIIESLSLYNNSQYYLYGNVNSTIRYLFPGIVCSLIIDNKNRKISIITILYFIGFLYLFTNIYSMATGLIGFIFLFAWMFFRKWIQNRIRKVYLITIAAITAVEVGIITFTSNSWLVVFAGFFGKDIKFSGRYYLWRKVLTNIKSSLVIGHGYLKQTALKQMIGNQYGSHNYYLDTVLSGGLVSVVIFVAIVFLLYHYVDSEKMDTIDYILTGSLLSIFIMFLAEPFRGWEHTFIPIICVELVRLRPVKDLQWENY